MGRLRDQLGRPLFGTRVLPPDGRVDPAGFPEEEFPVHCPRCDYLLRGLPDGRCPECGEPFDRGRLLVLEYAQWRVRRQRVYNKTLSLLSGVTLAVLLGGFLTEYALRWRMAALSANPTATGAQFVAAMEQWRLLNRVILVVMLALMALFAAAGVAVVIHYRRRASKRRRVLAAMDAAGQNPR